LYVKKKTLSYACKKNGVKFDCGLFTAIYL